MKSIYFHDALRSAAAALSGEVLAGDRDVRLIRDVYGRIRFAINDDAANVKPELSETLMKVQVSLGAYASPSGIAYRDSFAFPDDVFNDSGWHKVSLEAGVDADGAPLGVDMQFMLLDRQITGQDWLRLSNSSSDHPHRVVFFGLKGGVGRSTALCMTAWGLAREGKRVLLVDFDLESPGLSGLILPIGNSSEFGVVDWLVEDAVGQGEAVLGNLVSASPLGETTTGAIRVVGAIGGIEEDYLSKLSRVYVDVSSGSQQMRIGDRMRRLIEILEEREKPDVVLIDSRAGLHDLAAISIAGLADTALLFATDGAQTWNGYRQLFSHWQRRPEVVSNVRERLAFVRALTPSSERAGKVKDFRRRAYELFAECLYDNVPTGAEDGGIDLFHPSEGDEAAPHFPILVDWDERFQEFDPSLRPEDGGATEAQINATFGALIRWVNARVAGEDV